MSHITQTYILLNVSAGIVEERGRDPIVYASVEVANINAKSTGNADRVSYGSPVVKLNLVDENTGNPNIELAKRLEREGLYGKPVPFRGVFDIVKKKGVEQMSFMIFDVESELVSAKPMKAAS